jgi:hypothetical protein
MEGVQATEEASSPQKRTASIKNKTINFLIYFLGHSCPPGFGPGSGGPKFTPIPDPRHCKNIDTRYYIGRAFFLIHYETDMNSHG